MKLEIVNLYINSCKLEHCFETPNLHVLDEAFRPYGAITCFQAEYFLPDVNILKELDCPYEVRVLHKKNFEGLYLSEWSNVKSARNAIKSGFRPAWVEMTVKSKQYVNEIIGGRDGN